MTFNIIIIFQRCQIALCYGVFKPSIDMIIPKTWNLKGLVLRRNEGKTLLSFLAGFTAKKIQRKVLEDQQIILN